MGESKNPCPPKPPDLLLYSLGEFEDLIRRYLDLLKPDSICEIGINGARLSNLFVDLCRERVGRYTGIDTQIDVEWGEKTQGDFISVHRGASLGILPDLPSHDLYVIDGDHNYYTVYHELGAIFEKPPGPRTVILHDVAWPCARRDLYYDPGSIPKSERHPYSYSLGAVPGEPTLQEGGYSGNGNFAWALEEGGPKNGVLSAVEDRLSDLKLSKWEFITVPVVFGIGFLFHPDRLSPDTLEFLNHLDDSLPPFAPIFEALELNRIQLYLERGRASKFIRTLQDHIDESHNAYSALASAYKELNEHSAKLLKAHKGLSEHSAKLLKAYKELRNYADQLEGERRP